MFTSPMRALSAAALLSMAFPHPAYAAAPAAPGGAEVGTAVNAGGGPSVANLWWNSNTESDLKSYQVYRTTSTSGVVVNSSWTVAIATMAVEGTTTVESGLTNEATYYYAIVAVNLGAELSAASVTVSTKPAAGAANPSPAAPTAPGAAAVAAGGALNLSWTAPADLDLKDYRIFRSTLSGAVTAKKLWTAVVAPGTTRQDAGLTNGATYYYQLIARDANLNGSPATAEFSAVPQDTLAPAIPTGLTRAVGIGLVNLSWSTNTEADLKDYRLHRSTNTGVVVGSTWTATVATVLAPGTTHRDGALTNEATYYYRLTARDASANESGASGEVSGRPDGTAPTSGITSPTDGSRVSSLTTISGTSFDGGSGVAQVAVSLRTGALYWNGAGWAVGETWVIATGTNPWVYAAPVWSDGVVYVIRSSATDVAGNVQAVLSSVTFTFDVSPPAAPTGAGVQDPGSGVVLNLTWTANTEGDLKDYRIWRSTNAGVTLVSTHTLAGIAAPGTTFQDSGLTAGLRYNYRITARDTAQPGSNESAGSTEFLGVPGAPAVPTGFGLSNTAGGANAGERMSLSWTGNTEGDLKEYRVSRSTNAGVTQVSSHVVAGVAAPGTTHQDAGLTNGTTFYFRLSARDVGLNESVLGTELGTYPADVVAPTAPSAPVVTNPAIGQKLNLSWSAVSDGSLKDYGIYRATYSGAGATAPLRVTFIAAPGTTHQDGGLSNAVTYYYRVTARDATLNESGGSSETSAYPTDTTPPLAPLGVGVTDQPGDQGFALRLSWFANTEGDLKDYQMFRSTYGSLLTQKILLATVASPGTTHLDVGLSLGATYYYQTTARDTSLNASGGSGEVSAYPVDNLAPATPVGLSGVDAPGDQGFAINIAWVTNTEPDLKDYGVYRATFTGLLGTKSLRTRVTAPGTTHQDSGLTNATTYYYQVTARDASGNESGAGADFSAFPVDNLAPTVPAGLIVVDTVTPNTVLYISWTAGTESDLKDYGVYRALASGALGTKTLLTRVASPGTTHQDGSLVTGTRYFYQMTARDVSLNESGGSSEVSGVPGAPATPPAPGIADVAADGGTALNLSWTANTESDLKDYGVYRATWALASPAPSLTRIAAPGTTHQAAGLISASTYYFRLTARDLSLNESGYSTEASASPVDNIPGVPAGVVAADAPGDQGFAIRIFWAPNSDTDMKDYGVYRASFVGAGLQAGPVVRIASPGTTHQDAGLTNGATFYYRVTARDLALQESGGSAEVSAIPSDNLAPSSPTAFGVADVPSDQGFALRLSWTANTEPDRKDYGVYRATWAGASPAPTPTRIANPGTTHQDAGLTNGTTYYFRLTARDVSLNDSGYSTETSAIPYDNLAPATPAGPGVADAGVDQGDRLNLSWAASAEPDLKDYGVYRATWAGASPAPTRLVARIVVPGTTQQDTGLNPLTTFYYRLTARDVSLNESGPTADAALKPTDEIPPAAPSVLVSSNTGIGRRLRLNWAANTEPDLKDYLVYRSTNTGVTLVSSQVVTAILQPGTTHSDGGLTDGTTYYYRLTARDQVLNESAALSDVSAYPTDTTAPGVPAGLAASNTLGGANAGTRLTLTWTANTETDLKDYRVFRSTNGNVTIASTWTITLATIVQPGTTHQDGGLMNNTTYYYRLSARDLTLNESGLPSADTSAYPADIVPPSPPAFSVVVTVGISGALKLIWNPNTEADLANYQVYRATLSGSLGTKSLVAGVTSSATSYLALGLTLGTTYFWQVTARDVTGNESPASTELSGVAGTDTIAPAMITNLAAVPGTLDGYAWLTWTAVGDDGTEGTATLYQVRYAVTQIGTEANWGIATPFPQSWTPQAPGTTEVRQVGPLASGTTYYFAIKAYDEVGNAGSVSNITGNSAPAQNLPPGPPALASKNLNWGVRLTLTPPADPDLLRYIIFSSVFQGGPYVQIATVPVTSAVYEDVFTTLERRYYVVRLEDKTGYQGANSAEVSGKPDANLPVAPTDVKAMLTDAGTVVSWRPPVRYLNGTSYDEKSGSRIERTPALTSPWVNAAEVGADAASWTDASGGNFFYRVRALTGPKVPGPPSLVVSNQPGGSTMALGTDDQGRVAAILEIGRDAVDDLRAATNGSGQDVFIEVVRKPELRTADVIEAFDFQPSLAGTGEKIAHFRFRRPVAMKFLYQTDGGQISRLGVPASQAASALAVYTHNGIDWVNLGGEVDTDRREVKAKTSSLSLYRLARAARATEFRLVQVVPPKVFTPNGDGVWDTVEFFFENPAGATVTGKIVDARGAQVADLRIGGRGTSLVWDGLDSDGRPAPGGVYLYQIEFDGKVIHGAIVLAR